MTSSSIKTPSTANQNRLSSQGGRRVSSRLGKSFFAPDRQPVNHDQPRDQSQRQVSKGVQRISSGRWTGGALRPWLRLEPRPQASSPVWRRFRPTTRKSLVGPLGFEPRTDGLKVSGSSLKTARKTHQKRTKLQVSGQKSTKQRRFQATFQIQTMTNMTILKGQKLRSQAKTVHVC